MGIKSEKFTISTKGFDDFIDITQKVQNIVSRFDIKEGLLNVTVVSSTASITTLEYEPGLVSDLPSILNTIIPINKVYEHDLKWHDGNAFAHIKATLIGNNITLPIINGDIKLITWQQIVLIDFDNKTNVREIVVSVTY